MFVFEQIRTGGDRNFAYLIGDADAKTAVVIDPSYDPKAVVGRAKDQQLTVTHVINTHGHPDHTNGNAEAVKLTGAKLLAYKTAASRPDVTVDHEDTLAVGAFTLKFLFTPGHAEDHLCVLVDDVCLTGDVLFVGKVGGTAGSDAAETEYRSLHNVVLKLPDDTTKFDVKGLCRKKSLALGRVRWHVGAAGQELYVCITLRPRALLRHQFTRRNTSTTGKARQPSIGTAL